MGLNIVGNFVEVDHSHNRLLNTSVLSNPRVSHTEAGNSVYEIFQRQKTPKSLGRDLKGDNCHLLYALKGKDDLVTSAAEIKKLLPNFYGILDKAKLSADLVVAAPSSVPIASILAKRVALLSGATFVPGIFSKILVEDAIRSLKALPITREDRKLLESRLKKSQSRGSANLALKDIPVNFREYFSPLVLNDGSIKCFDCPRMVLVVDDLMSTGTTIDNAVRLLKDLFPKAEFLGLTLFGKIHEKD